jgi:soluble lytic murein transglycosylase
VWLGLVAVLIGGQKWFGEQAAQSRLEAFLPLIREQAGLFNLDPHLVAAVIMVESSAKADARSGADALGLMQIRAIAETEVHRKHDLPHGNLFEPRYNIMIGCAYLADCGKRFRNAHGPNWIMALAAYNAGPTKMAKLRRAHPSLGTTELIDRYAPKETRAYYRKVIHWYKRFQADSPFETDQSLRSGQSAAFKKPKKQDAT